MPPYSSFPGASCEEMVSGANRAHGECANAHWSLQTVCVANVQSKGPQLLIFFSQCKMNQSGWAAGERGSLENSSGTTARAGILDTEPCKNTLILPGSSPSFCN